MPPRYLTFSIVAFWLATTGWLFQRELWPRMRPGEPPPYAIDLADEAQQQLSIRWTIYRGERIIGRATTRTLYREADDTFELHNEVRNLELGGGRLQVKSMYRVGRDGELREMTAKLGAQIALLRGEARLAGEVREGKFWPRCQVAVAGGAMQDVKIEPFEISTTGAVLNPLHPVNRIAGLHPGQSWRQPVSDPLTDALTAIGGLKASGPRHLEARVLPEVETLTWNGKQVPCLVIEYTGEQGVGARTWVRQDNGAVLKQEAHQGDVVVLLRDR